ncbi:hypothetical protein DFH09DRAFT_1318888 [Mycena vulgaris]|nr:hypothetical protein DFH09DRAFT_1318888 [Mycena vulgaris]
MATTLPSPCSCSSEFSLGNRPGDSASHNSFTGEDRFRFPARPKHDKESSSPQILSQLADWPSVLLQPFSRRELYSRDFFGSVCPILRLVVGKEIVIVVPHIPQISLRARNAHDDEPKYRYKGRYAGHACLEGHSIRAGRSWRPLSAAADGSLRDEAERIVRHCCISKPSSSSAPHNTPATSRRLDNPLIFNSPLSTFANLVRLQLAHPLSCIKSRPSPRRSTKAPENVNPAPSHPHRLSLPNHPDLSTPIILAILAPDHSATPAPARRPLLPVLLADLDGRRASATFSYPRTTHRWDWDA